MRNAVLRPSASEVDLEVVRADEIAEGGHITLQVLEHCAHAKVAVADLTGRNLNVYYEVGIRHAVSRPLVLIADDSERERLPFDLLQQRTIFYTDDLAGAAECREKVTEQLRKAVAGHVDSPVVTAANLRALSRGDTVEQTLADLVWKVERLTTRVSEPEPVPEAVGLELLQGISMLTDLVGDENGAQVLRALEVMAPAVLSLTRFRIDIWDQPELYVGYRALGELQQRSRRRAHTRSDDVEKAVKDFTDRHLEEPEEGAPE